MSKVINCDLKNLGKAIEKEIRNNEKQIKFASMKALNETAFTARTSLICAYKGAFNVRNTSLPKKVTVVKATKEKLESSVNFPFDWFYLNTKGGTKKPEVKKSLFVPIKYGVPNSRMNSGKIKISYKPGSLLKYSDNHPKKKRGKVANPHAFLKIKNKKGQLLLARRDKADRSQMEWLYVQVPTGKILKRWDFEEIVKKTVDRNLKKEFDKALKWALENPKK